MEKKKEIKKRLVKRLVFEIDKEKHKEIKMLAAHLGVSMKKCIDEAMKHYINFLKRIGD